MAGTLLSRATNFLAASLNRSRQRSIALLSLRSSLKAVKFMPAVNPSIRTTSSRYGVFTRYAAGSIESGQQVNVGIRAAIVARRGAEQRQVHDADRF